MGPVNCTRRRFRPAGSSKLLFQPAGGRGTALTGSKVTSPSVRQSRHGARWAGVTTPCFAGRCVVVGTTLSSAGLRTLSDCAKTIAAKKPMVTSDNSAKLLQPAINDLPKPTCSPACFQYESKPRNCTTDTCELSPNNDRKDTHEPFCFPRFSHDRPRKGFQHVRSVVSSRRLRRGALRVAFLD